jgi:hypothetical protein
LSQSPDLSDQTARRIEPSSPSTDGSFRNPSYPQRTHLGERKLLEEKLHAWEGTIAAMGKKLMALGSHPQRATYERLYHQMQGARDQMADAVRRMPTETGDLYDEDHHRLIIAEAALTSVLKRWDSMKA